MLADIHGYATYICDLRREPAQMRARAEARLVLSTESGYVTGRALSEVYLGWADALAGDLDGGMVRMRHHLSELRAANFEVAAAYHLALIATAPTEGLGATPGDSPYVVAKTGVIGLTHALAADLGPEGITVNCICPGPIRTNLTDAIPEEHKTIFAKRRTVVKRYGYPEEVAHITFSLCLPAASYLTGAVIPVDGGLTIRNA